MAKESSINVTGQHGKRDTDPDRARSSPRDVRGVCLGVGPNRCSTRLQHEIGTGECHVGGKGRGVMAEILMSVDAPTRPMMLCWASGYQARKIDSVWRGSVG